MKTAVQVALLLVTLPCGNFAKGTEFEVEPSGRHLLLKDNPLFWLADTTWLLAQTDEPRHGRGMAGQNLVRAGSRVITSPGMEGRAFVGERMRRWRASNT